MRSFASPTTAKPWRSLLRVHSFAPAQSLAILASFAVHLIRPTHLILGVGFEIAVLIGNTITPGVIILPQMMLFTRA